MKKLIFAILFIQTSYLSLSQGNTTIQTNFYKVNADIGYPGQGIGFNVNYSIHLNNKWSVILGPGVAYTFGLSVIASNVVLNNEKINILGKGIKNAFFSEQFDWDKSSWHKKGETGTPKTNKTINFYFKTNMGYTLNFWKKHHASIYGGPVFGYISTQWIWEDKYGTFYDILLQKTTMLKLAVPYYNQYFDYGADMGIIYNFDIGKKHCLGAFYEIGKMFGNDGYYIYKGLNIGVKF